MAPTCNGQWRREIDSPELVQYQIELCSIEIDEKGKDKIPKNQEKQFSDFFDRARYSHGQKLQGVQFSSCQNGKIVD